MLHFQVGSEGRRESFVDRLLRYAVSPYQFWSFLRRNRPTIVHINTAMVPKAYWRDLAYVAVSKSVGSKVIYQVHGGSAPLEFFRARRLPTAFLKATLRMSDAIVLLSEIDRRDYLAFDPGLPLRVVPNAIEMVESSVRKTRRPEVPLRLVYIGRLVSAKGIFEVVEALALLRAEGIDANMVFAGSGEDEQRLRARVNELGLDDRVEFRGVVSGRDKDALWEASDVFVFPSHREGLPYALLESMAARTVPVVCPVGAIPEVMQDGREGLFVPPNDPVRLADAIRHLHENRAALDVLGEAGRSRVAARYTVNRLADAFEKIYQEI
ncbi:MAG TPA: glycosyltransferase family 4 protein [Thermodesulfobacteriota bacterium]|nr:glycosyltransferase family 4 protein [Thermodesulfobacteriota bacterium]